MITESAPFLSANAALAKQPIYVLTFDSYSRAFSNYEGSPLPGPTITPSGTLVRNAGSVNFVVSGLSDALLLPIGATFDITTATDSSFNGTNFIVTFVFVLRTGHTIVGYKITYSQAGSAATSTTATVTPHVGGSFGLGGDAGYGFPWIEDISDQGKTINDLSGLADMHEIDVTITDTDNILTSDLATNNIEGSPVTIRTGFPGMVLADYVTIFTGVVNSIDSTNDNNSYVFSLYDNSATLSQTVYSLGDNGLATSQDNPKTLNGHPLDILLDILGNQLQSQYGAFFSPVFVDVDRIKAYRDGPLAGIQFSFSLVSPVVAAEFIASQLLVPLGGYLWINAAGQFTVNFFYPIESPTSVFAVDETNLVGIPTASQFDLVNSIEFRFDSNGTDYFSDVTEEDVPSVLQYGFVGSIAIQSDGMRSGLQGFLLAAATARMIFLRYGFYNLGFGNSSGRGSALGSPVTVFWTASILEPGDLLSITCSKIPDRKLGVMGITNRLFQVLERTYDFKNGTVQFTLVDAEYLKNIGFFKIAPNTINAYSAETTLNKSTYLFLCDDNNKYANGDDANTLD